MRHSAPTSARQHSKTGPNMPPANRNPRSAPEPIRPGSGLQAKRAAEGRSSRLTASARRISAVARAAGATDTEIHDTVLIAAVFCMFNRYVDGLATVAPDDSAAYAAGAQRLIMHGYLPPPTNPGREE